MITRNFEITIRIPEQNYIPTLFQVVENDKDVYNLTIHITDGINEIDYSQVSSATITFALANGAVVQSDPERLAISSGGITYEMGTTEISCPGKVLASIQLFGSSGERLTTARFRFEVVADLITPDAVQSESRFPILQQLVADVEQLKQDIVDLQIPDNSIMDEKLSNAAGQIKQRFASHMADYATHKTDYARLAFKALGSFAGPTDFNTLGDIGLRRVAETGHINIPPGFNGYGVVEVRYGNDNGYIVQDVTQITNGRRWTRVTSASAASVKSGKATWTNWVEIITSNIVRSGSGSPEGVITASVGTLYRRTDGGASTTLYVKESGTGNTGWKAVQTA